MKIQFISDKVEIPNWVLKKLEEQLEEDTATVFSMHVTDGPLTYNIKCPMRIETYEG